VTGVLLGGALLLSFASSADARTNRCLRDGYSVYRSYRGPVQIVVGQRYGWLYACWAPSGRLTRMAQAPRSSLGEGAPYVPRSGYAIGGRYVLYIVGKATRPPSPDRLWKLDARAGRARELSYALGCPLLAPDPVGQVDMVARGVVAPAINAHGSAAWACVTVDGLVQRMDARGVAVLDSWRIPPFGPFTAPVIRLRRTKLSWRIPGRLWRSARLVDKC